MARITEYDFGRVTVDGGVRRYEELAAQNPAAVAAALHLTC